VKRSILLAFIAALVMAVGFSPSVGAVTDSGANASAKKGAKCKAKGKKGKAKSSASASAKGKKGKGKGCKGKAKGKKGKGKVTVPTPTPAPPSNWPPADGEYSDEGHGLGVTLSGGGTKAVLAFSGGQDTCVALTMATDPVPTTLTPETLSASGQRVIFPGLGDFTMKMSIEIKNNLSYTATIDSSIKATENTYACDKPGVVIKGTLTKLG
jgi:hypothetical protein